MPELRPVLLVTGLLLVPLGLFMLLPAALDAFAGDPDWPIFLAAAGLTLVCAVTLILANRADRPALNVQQAFLLTSLSWITLAAFAALPLAFSQLNLTYTDAFFEAMSGLTTTGSTVITGLDHAPRGLLLWRALLQWLGGIGIIVTAVAVLPMLRIGGMQLFRMESSDSSEKIIPRAAQLAGYIALIYGGLSLACALLYLIAGMSLFDSITHAMTTLATGGFANSDRSFAAFDSPAIEMAAILFMILGSLPFVLYLQALRGKPQALLQDDQVRWFCLIAAAAVFLLWLYLMIAAPAPPAAALRQAAFNAVSILTGTGYASANYANWGGFAAAFFFCLMFIGGCAGSTSCGIKVFRFVIAGRMIARAMRRIAHPRAAAPVRYNDRPVANSVAAAVMSFVFLYIFCWILAAALLNLIGLDFLTALSAAASAISNVGPGLGQIIGPDGSYAPLEPAAKWLLALIMLAGRLELFTILVLFAPAFWRR